MWVSRTNFDRTPIRRAALWTADKDRRRKLFRAVRALTGEDPWGITDSPLADDGTLLRKTRPRGKVEFFLGEPTAEELIAELSAVRRTRAFTVVTVLNGDETSRYTRVLVDPRQVDPESKEASVAADIEVKRFTRQRVEYWIPTGCFDGDGGRFEDLGLAHAWARQELVERGVIKEDDSAEGHVRIKPSDEHVIVCIEFDEEQKK